MYVYCTHVYIVCTKVLFTLTLAAGGGGKIIDSRGKGGASGRKPTPPSSGKKPVGSSSGRKETGSKVRNQCVLCTTTCIISYRDKANASNDTQRQLLFSREKEDLPRAGLEPAMFCVLGRCCTS